MIAMFAHQSRVGVRLFPFLGNHLWVTRGPVVSHRIDARTFCFKSLSFVFVCSHRRPCYPSPPNLWVLPRRLFHTSLSLRTFLRNSRSRSSLSDVSTRTIPRGRSLHLLHTMFSAHVFPVRPSFLLDAAVQTPFVQRRNS